MKKLLRFWSFLTAQRPAVYGGIYFFAIPTFAAAFWLVQGFKPEKISFWEAVYFSVVTITTLGYGDIQPGLIYTRMLAAAEAVVGVLMIGLFLSALSHSRSEENASEEAKRIAKLQLKESVYSVIKHSLLLRPKIDRFKVISDRLSTREKDVPREYREGFPIANFTEIFGPTGLLNDNPYRPKIEVYFESISDLKEEFERLLISVDLSHWPDFQVAVIGWLQVEREYDRSRAILHKPKMRFGQRPLLEWDKEMLEQFTGEIRVQGSHMMDDYCILHMQLSALYRFTRTIRQQLDRVLTTGDSVPTD